jgi:hypothetical protein
MCDSEFYSDLVDFTIRNYDSMYHIAQKFILKSKYNCGSSYRGIPGYNTV